MDAVTPASRHPVVALGEFDGMHIGHHRLLAAAAVLAARERRPLVAVVLDDVSATARLESVDAICRRLIVAGAGSARVLGVDSLAPGSGPSIADRLAGELEPSHVVVACLPGVHDPRYPALRPALRDRRIDVVEVDRACTDDGSIVSSRSIRDALLAGEAAAARQALGRPYSLRGEVVHGSGLGRTIGYPTANVPPPPDRLLPALGVYAGTARLPGGSEWCCAINVGVRPTVELAGTVLIEAHLLDFDGDLYGDRIDVAFHERVRGELRFESVDALVAQLQHDVERIRRSGA